LNKSLKYGKGGDEPPVEVGTGRRHQNGGMVMTESRTSFLGAILDLRQAWRENTAAGSPRISQLPSPAAAWGVASIVGDCAVLLEFPTPACRIC
jgi:hypothetical protein